MSFFSFFFCKIEEQEDKAGPWEAGGCNHQGKGGRRVNIVQKCVHIYVNAKMIPVETIPGME
jgi:hypothetical protein